MAPSLTLPCDNGSAPQQSPLEIAAEFLRSIGLDVVEQPGAAGFLQGTAIKQGKLLYDPMKAEASDLLHEAGHLAVLPTRYRSWADDNILQVQLDMMEEVEKQSTNDDFDPDAPEIRAVMQAGECEATAWAFAAGLACGLPDETIIQDHEYDREGASVRAGLKANCYLGINGLVHGGMCENVRAYPTLTRWLQN
ncbi:hypothetical protein [Erythrobacter aureus]|uniref:Uncharacterized protein n=1 Tax=Erythrobacter aureus TaxID=2182384 RepID=A0A345YIV5_9SPHN|nr:hypothetical protein [Erythrobacter aureus]AXK43857.1 hypothetical protein DVR09_15495 [Erythrobacter aureus]